MPSPRRAVFPGFDRHAMQFWHELSAEMSREWFAAHKPRYETQWVAPLTVLLQGLARRLAPTYQPLTLGEPRALRIYRDVRFARDKTPYKTHIAGVLRLAGVPVAEAGNAVIYLQLGLDADGRDDDYVGCGCYQLDPVRRARWRKAVVGAPGAALLAILAKLRKAGYAPAGHETYRRVPPGFAPDHPRAALLKMKGVICPFPEIPAGLIHQPAFADWLFRHAKATAPLVIWLHRHLD